MLFQLKTKVQHYGAVMVTRLRERFIKFRVTTYLPIKNGKLKSENELFFMSASFCRVEQFPFGKDKRRRRVKKTGCLTLTICSCRGTKFKTLQNSPLINQTAVFYCLVFFPAPARLYSSLPAFEILFTDYIIEIVKKASLILCTLHLLMHSRSFDKLVTSWGLIKAFLIILKVKTNFYLG